MKCNICNGIFYGKTKHHLKVRVCEHLGITPSTGKKVKSLKESIMFNPIFHTGHSINFEKFKILAKESHEFRLLFRELLLISHDDPPLNKYVEFIPREFFHNYLQFSFIISVIVVILLIIWLFSVFNILDTLNIERKFFLRHPQVKSDLQFSTFNYNNMTSLKIFY